MTPVSAAALVFVEDLAAPVLSADDRWHLSRVLRLPAGADVAASDGAGRWRPCELGRAGHLVPVGEVVVEPVPVPPVTVAFALVKGERPELVVQKLTELGVDRIVPFVAERSVVRWDPDKVARRYERFEQIARQAAMQCRRCHLPAVGLPGPPGLPDFGRVADLPGAALADAGGEPPQDELSTILVGPEGGWTEAEWAVVRSRVRLGANVLRAETAAIAAGTLLVALRSDIVSTSISSQVAVPPQS